MLRAGDGGATGQSGSLDCCLEESQSETPILDGIGWRNKPPSCLRHYILPGLFVTAANMALTNTVTIHLGSDSQKV